jgi:hypothetical protein
LPLNYARIRRRANEGIRTLTARLGRPACDHHTAFAKLLGGPARTCTENQSVNNRPLYFGATDPDRRRARSRSCTRGPLLTRQVLCWLSYTGNVWSHRPDLHRRLPAYEADAVATEPRWRAEQVTEIESVYPRWQRGASPVGLTCKMDPESRFNREAESSSTTSSLPTVRLCDHRQGPRSPCLSSG